VVVAVSIWEMLEPDPSEAPETSDSTTVQSKVVPVTLLVNEIAVEVPEQIVWAEGVIVATGIGFTDITTGKAVPEHPFANDEMV
jgi:hypothetical protein